MPQDHPAQDPLEFVRSMWSSMGFSLPGMMTPTLDVDELDKRIADLKAVESWLKMNLNMLQMTTQGLEMQRVALVAVQAMSRHVRESAGEGQTEEANANPNPFAAAAAMWPWNLMGTHHAPEAEAEAVPENAAQEPPPAKEAPQQPAEEPRRNVRKAASAKR